MYSTTKLSALTATVAAGAAMMGTALSGAALAQEGEAHLLIYQQLSATQIIPIVDGFTEYYESETGEEIQVDNFTQPGGQLQSTILLEARAGAVRADIIITTPEGFLAISEDAPDLLVDYNPENLDDEAVSPSVREQSRAHPGAIIYMDPYVISYNTENVTGDDVPTSWLDLLEPRFENRIGLGDIEQTSGSRSPLWFLVKRMGDEVGEPFGWAYYDELGKQNPRLFGSHSPLLDNIASGELDVGIVGYSTTFRAATGGSPVAAVLPEEGAGAQPVAVEMTTQGESNPAATMFMEWMLSQDGQQAVYEGVKSVPVRSDVTVEEAPFNFDTTSTTIEPIDAEWISDNMEENVAKFRDALGS